MPASARRRLPAPRWQTPLPDGVIGSWGPLVADYMRQELRIVPDRWQELALNRALAYGADLKLVHRVYLVSLGRQNGKTTLVRGLVGTALTARQWPDWRTIVGLAHDRKQARVPYEAVYSDLEAMAKRVGRSRLALTMYLGLRSRLHGRHVDYNTFSREAADAIRTFSVDLGLFDEIRTQRTHQTWNALEPTTRARPDPLIFGISTAGDDRSVLLREWWERGLRIIEGGEPAAGFGMTWYAAPDELAADDPRAIRAANPAVAEGRVPLAPVAASIRSLTTTGYLQETLNLWSEGSDEWLPPGTWRRAGAPQPPTAGKLVLAVEAAPTWRRVSVMVAYVTDAGVWIGLADEIDSARTSRATVSPKDLVELVDRAAKRYHATELAFSGQAAVAPHLRSWCEASKVRPIELGMKQIRAASTLFRSELIAGRLTVQEHPLLAQQARVARPTGSLDSQDWYFGVTDAMGEIDALRAGVYAAWAAIAPEAREPGHGIHV